MSTIESIAPTSWKWIFSMAIVDRRLRLADPAEHLRGLPLDRLRQCALSDHL